MSSSNETRARLLIVPHFANNHIRGAAALARASYDLELQLDKGLDGFPFWEHKGNVVGCLLMTVAFLEATINELIFSANVNVNKWDPGKAQENYRALEKLGLIEGIQRLNFLEKYQLALAALSKELFVPGENPYQDVKLLGRLRNILVHFYPEPAVMVLPESEDEQHKLVRALRGKFQENKVATKMGRNHYPDILLGYGCAKWAIASSISFVGEFNERVNLKDVYHEVLNKLP